MPFLSSVNRAARSARQGRGVFARALAGLWLLLYVGIVAAAPVADGFVDHSDQVVVHVEDADGGPCPSSHGSDACDICQLAHGLREIVLPAAVLTPGVADVDLVATADRGIAAVELRFLDGRSSRAPPLV